MHLVLLYMDAENELPIRIWKERSAYHARQRIDSTIEEYTKMAPVTPDSFNSLEYIDRHFTIWNVDNCSRVSIVPYEIETGG